MVYGAINEKGERFYTDLAKIENVPCDSSLTLFLSVDRELVAKFKTGYPQSEDLTSYITRHEKA